MTDHVAAPVANHPFRYVNGCGKHNRTIFTSDGGVTIHIGCSVYTPENARNAITRKYDDRPDRRVKYLAAVERLVNDDIPFDPEQFNWRENSDDLIRHAPHLFVPERYNWEDYSWAIVYHAPELFDSAQFNWRDCSGDLVQNAPQYFDPELYNWAKHSWAIAKFAPQFFDTERYNWAKYSSHLVYYAPQYFDPERYNWRENSDDLFQYAPELYAQHKDRVVPSIPTNFSNARGIK